MDYLEGYFALPQPNDEDLNKVTNWWTYNVDPSITKDNLAAELSSLNSETFSMKVPAIEALFKYE